MKRCIDNTQLFALSVKAHSLDYGALSARLQLIETYLDQFRRQNDRRRRERRTAAAIVFMFLTCAALAGSSGHHSGNLLRQYAQYNADITFPALDSMATWGRKDVAGAPPGYTTEILSLIADGSQSNSYLWPLYIELRGTNSSLATMETSQSVGSTVRGIVRSAGSPWTANYHSELAHGRNAWDGGSVVATSGTSILYNGEIRSFTDTGKTIGLNLQCTFTDSSSRHCDQGINIQAGSMTTFWQDGIHFDQNGANLSGDVGINFDHARFRLGLDLGHNSMHIDAGEKIFMDAAARVFIWNNPRTQRVEIVREGVVVGSF